MVIWNLMVFAVSQLELEGMYNHHSEGSNLGGSLLLLHLILVPGDPAASTQRGLIGKERGGLEQVISIPKAESSSLFTLVTSSPLSL